VPFKGRRRYSTQLGAVYEGNALELLTVLEDGSVQAIITSPPFALKTKKKYGNPTQDEYLGWFLKFAPEFRRVLSEDGSLVIDIGGAWMPGCPTRSIYQFELLVALVRDHAFFLAEEFYWYNRAKLPGPAQWVTIERSRVKDSVNPIWWLSKTDRPKADNRRVLKPYSASRRGYNKGRRPSGHVVRDKFATDNGGAIPSNLIEVSNTRSVDSYQIGHVAWLREEIGALDDLGTFEGQVIVNLYADERDRVARVAKACLDAGVAERQIKLAEIYGAALANVLRNVFDDDDLGITPAQREQLPTVLRRYLGALEGGRSLAPVS
jgi:hypothetical protein